MRNAFRPQTLFELQDAFNLARDDDEVGVIVLTGQPDDHGARSWATEAVKGGAFSLVSKSAGFDCQKLLDGIGLAVLRSQQAQENSSSRPRA